MVDVVLLELEGVLFDTAALRRASVRDACAAHGISVAATETDVAPGVHPRALVITAMARSGRDGDHVIADLIERDAERAFLHRVSLGGVALQPGSRRFVDRATANTRLAVITRARREEADALLRLSGFETALSCVVTADDVIDPKPSPEGILLALERVGRQRRAPHAAVIALEDGADGIRAARVSRIRCVAVGPVPPHVAMDADAYVASLAGHTPATLDALSLPGRERVQ